MATAMLSQLLKVYVSKFVESGGLYAESGDIHGDDLYVNCSVVEAAIAEATNEVELGVHLTMVHCKKFKLEIPWSLLRSEDCLAVTVDELTIVLSQQDPRLVSGEELRQQKEARIRGAMERLLESVLSAGKQPGGGGRRGSTGGGGGSGGGGGGSGKGKQSDAGAPSGYLMAAIRKVLRRCRPKIEIKQVHIRYEHRGSEGAVVPFSTGVALGELSLDLAPGTDVARCPRLGLRVIGLGVYLSTGNDAGTVLKPTGDALIADNQSVRAATAARLAALREHPGSHEWVVAPLHLEGEVDLNLSLLLETREEALSHFPLVVVKLHVPPIAVRLTNTALTALLSCASWMVLAVPRGYYKVLCPPVKTRALGTGAGAELLSTAELLKPMSRLDSHEDARQFWRAAGLSIIRSHKQQSAVSLEKMRLRVEYERLFRRTLELGAAAAKLQAVQRGRLTRKLGRGSADAPSLLQTQDVELDGAMSCREQLPRLLPLEEQHALQTMEVDLPVDVLAFWRVAVRLTSSVSKGSSRRLGNSNAAALAQLDKSIKGVLDGLVGKDADGADESGPALFTAGFTVAVVDLHAERIELHLLNVHDSTLELLRQVGAPQSAPRPMISLYASALTARAWVVHERHTVVHAALGDLTATHGDAHAGGNHWLRLEGDLVGQPPDEKLGGPLPVPGQPAAAAAADKPALKPAASGRFSTWVQGIFDKEADDKQNGALAEQSSFGGTGAAAGEAHELHRSPRGAPPSPRAAAGAAAQPMRLALRLHLRLPQGAAGGPPATEVDLSTLTLTTSRALWDDWMVFFDDNLEEAFDQLPKAGEAPCGKGGGRAHFQTDGKCGACAHSQRCRAQPL